MKVALRRLATTQWPLAAAALFLSACVTRAEIEELKANQEKILAKLDKVQAGPARPSAPSGPQPGQPDPSKTYSITYNDDAPFKGGKDAWVTVVEVSDFQ